MRATAALFLSLGACADADDTFTLDVLWWINSLEPTRSLCDEQHIDEVSVRVRPLGAEDPETLESRFDCEQGGGWMRVPVEGGPLGLLDAGARYAYTVDALDRAGDVLHSSEGRFDAEGDVALVELPIVDFFAPEGDAALLSLEWRLPGTADLEQACVDRGVDEVALDLAAASDVDFVDALEWLRAPCAQGVVIEETESVASGEYWVRYVALDDRGAVVELGEPIELSVRRSDDEIALPTWDFQ